VQSKSVTFIYGMTYGR